MDGIILAGFDLNRYDGKAAVIVNQIIHLTLAAVIIVKQFVTVRNQFRGNGRFIDGSKIDAPLII